jgi:transposase
MMGERRVMQEAMFYGFNLERHVPDNHLLRKIDRFVDLSGLRAHLGPYYSDVGRPSIDPELIMRTLIVGYCFGIRSERRLCEEVHLNLAYRWFCRLGLDGEVPDHSTFSKNLTAASARAICCASCSRPWWRAASRRGSWEAGPLQSTPA